jgi:hypothetical protein
VLQAAGATLHVDPVRVTTKEKNVQGLDMAAAGLASESMMTGAVQATAPAAAAFLIIERRLRPRLSPSLSLGVGGTSKVLPWKAAKLEEPIESCRCDKGPS